MGYHDLNPPGKGEHKRKSNHVRRHQARGLFVRAREKRQTLDQQTRNRRRGNCMAQPSPRGGIIPHISYHAMHYSTHTQTHATEGEVQRCKKQQTRDPNFSKSKNHIYTPNSLTSVFLPWRARGTIPLTCISGPYTCMSRPSSIPAALMFLRPS